MRAITSVLGATLGVALMGTPVSANLVTNGDFSAGTTGWTYAIAGWAPDFFGPPDTAPGNDGVFNPGNSPLGDPVLRKSVGTNLAGSYWVYQVLSGLTVGETYTLSGIYAGGVGAFQDFNGAAWWEVGTFAGGYDFGKVDSPDPSYIAAKTETGERVFAFPWTAFTKDFVATDTSQTVYLKWGAWTPDWQYNFFGAYFDGISVVPEPATLALLALGALPLLRRRR